jgi:hypothetical protein
METLAVPGQFQASAMNRRQMELAGLRRQVVSRMVAVAVAVADQGPGQSILWVSVA